MTLLSDRAIAHNVSILFKYLESNYPAIEDGFQETLVKYNKARNVLERHSTSSRYELQIILTCIITLHKNLIKPHTKPGTFKDVLL